MDARQKIVEILDIADIKINGDRAHDIMVTDDRVYERWLYRSSLGFGESYMDGWWSARALDETTHHLFLNMPAVRARLKLDVPSIKLVASSWIRNRQTKHRSLQVVEKHYDIGNDLYEHMLGSTMQYSCAYWANGALDLKQAQLDKLDLIAAKLKLSPGMSVLEIGCGWGGLAAHLSKYYGVRVVGLTISKEQLKYAKAHFSDPDVEFLLKDYREYNAEPFDRVVSVGMLEHVWHKNFRVYMECINRMLTDDGICLIHSIGNAITQQISDPWIDKYIFPNGMLPSAKQIVNAIVEPMVVEDWHNFGESYDKTLCAWHERFVEAWPRLKASGKYDDRFYRMWEYYLLSCAGNFRSNKRAQLWQIVLSKSGVSGGYAPVR
ncbi:MAG: cyclopropane fatty acyl phospholipid synthase [Rhodobacteraceae bacterium]|nr:cyclopropane fatty acyl phospholipid synthase [Paracoccaceae bacterium]